MGNWERLSPKAGWPGMLPWWVWKVRVVFQPEMYWERKLRAIADEFASPRCTGSHRTWTTTLVLLPVVTSVSLTVACPMTELLLKTWMLKYGTDAVYRVGFVKLTLASRVKDVLLVSRILRSKMCGFMCPNSPLSPPFEGAAFPSAFGLFRRHHQRTSHP